RDWSRHLSALGQEHAAQARQGPLPSRPGGRRGGLPGGRPPHLRDRRLMGGQTAGLTARVTVTPKRGILDPQGKAVQQSLHVLGFPEVAEVRVGKYVELRLRDVDRAAASARVQAMCEQLLANGMIEDFHVEIVEGGL